MQEISSTTDSTQVSSQRTALPAHRIEHAELRQLFDAVAEFTFVETLDRDVSPSCENYASRTQRIHCQFVEWLRRIEALRAPTTDNLLTLVKFNVLRAMISNTTTLGLSVSETMKDECLSTFPQTNARTIVPVLPISLHPTVLQQKIDHHPWIDMLPIPRMRDNLLLAGDTYDDMAICGDLVGFFSSSRTDGGMVVWGEPWNELSWELTPEFVGRWAWTVQGCETLFRATNCWRERRGERPLRFELLSEVVSTDDPC